MARKCKLCRFWETEGFKEGSGQCRCGVPAKDAGGEPVSWPLTQDEDWCGEFRYAEKMEQKIPSICKFCEFWDGEEFNQEDGECHHNTPMESLGQSRASWPVTRDTQWCGQFLLRRGKLAVACDTCPV